MSIGLLGKKVGMTHVFEEDGTRVPVTVILAEPGTVMQARTVERDGYEALQLGFGEQKVQRLTKADVGHRRKAGKMVSQLVEARGASGKNVGDVIRVEDVFSAGDSVDVTGTSKGRGFAGVIKRHGFKGTKASHGTHEFFRHGGSIGACAFPGRVVKGKRMAGQYGNTRVTTQNLEIVAVRADDDVLLVKGAVPGARNGLVFIRKAVKAGGALDD